ncbi:hypothetical protein ACR3K2_26830 [Cryptosporidium serpentis]
MNGNKLFSGDLLPTWIFSKLKNNFNNNGIDLIAINKLIFEYAFDFNTILEISRVDKSGLIFYRHFQKNLFRLITKFEILGKQEWIKNPSTWLIWLYMGDKNDISDSTKINNSVLIPLEPTVTMDILFKKRDIYPISLQKKQLTDPIDNIFYLSIEMSAISISKSSRINSNFKKDEFIYTNNIINNDTINKNEQFKSIYDMLLYDSIIYAFEMVFNDPYKDLYDDEIEYKLIGGGDIIIYIDPNNIYNILKHKNFEEKMYNFFGLKNKELKLSSISGWNGYFLNGKIDRYSTGFLPKLILKSNELWNRSYRIQFPFLLLLLTSTISQRRIIPTEFTTLYQVVISLLDKYNEKSVDSIDFIKLIEIGLKYKAPCIIFFLDSSLLNHDSLDIVIKQLSDFECNKLNNYLSTNFIDESYSETIVNLNWLSEEYNGTPIFKESYNTKFKPPWRTSIESLISIFQKKETDILTNYKQPSIYNNLDEYFNSGIKIGRHRARITEDFNELSNESQNGYMTFNDKEIDNVIDLTSSLKLTEIMDNIEFETEIDSPSIVASGFVMGIPCLPKNAPITSLGSISESYPLGEINTQRLSIPASECTEIYTIERQNRFSSCRTHSSIATSWGTPVPITRTIPLDDVLGRRNEQIRNENKETNDQLGNINFFNSKIICNNEDNENNEDNKNNEDNNINASLLAQATLKSWKYVQYDVEDELEDEIQY